MFAVAHSIVFDCYSLFFSQKNDNTKKRKVLNVSNASNYVNTLFFCVIAMYFYFLFIYLMTKHSLTYLYFILWSPFFIWVKDPCNIYAKFEVTITFPFMLICVLKHNSFIKRTKKPWEKKKRHNLHKPLTFRKHHYRTKVPFLCRRGRCSQLTYAKGESGLVGPQWLKGRWGKQQFAVGHRRINSWESLPPAWILPRYVWGQGNW